MALRTLAPIVGVFAVLVSLCSAEDYNGGCPATLSAELMTNFTSICSPISLLALGLTIAVTAYVYATRKARVYVLDFSVFSPPDRQVACVKVPVCSGFWCFILVASFGVLLISSLEKTAWSCQRSLFGVMLWDVQALVCITP